MNIPKVSVIITCFNYGRFLHEAIISVLEQSYDDLEIIVCDDASTDETPEVMKLFEGNSKIIYMRHKENIGQSENRNAGIWAARGEYIAFLDADDTYAECKTKGQVDILDENPDYGVVYCPGHHYNEDMTKMINNAEMAHYPVGDVSEDLFQGSFMQGMSMMVRKELLHDVGGFPDKDETYGVGVDWRLLLELSTRTKFHAYKKHCYNYRIHGTQMSTNIERRINSDSKIRAMFLEKHPGLISEKALRQAKINAHLQAGYYYRKNGRKRDALREYMAIIRKNPLLAVAYKASLITIFCSTGTGGH